MLLPSLLTTWRMWARVLPALAEDYDVLALTLLGHGGRPWPETRPATLDSVVDDVVDQMSAAGLDDAHVAGVSMGGLVAMELARRGRARSVTAFAPGGGGPVPDTRLPRLLKQLVRQTRVSRPAMPLLMRSARVRRAALRTSIEHAERMTVAECLTMADDLVATSPRVHEAIGVLAQAGPQPYGDLGVPVHIAWPEHDRDTPFDPYGVGWDRLVPGARRSVVPDAGHLPVVDAPEAVLATIRATARDA